MAFLCVIQSRCGEESRSLDWAEATLHPGLNHLAVNWVSDRVLPSGSLNQQTLPPSGVVQMPAASCFIPSKRSNLMPFCASAATVAAMSGTVQPIAVNGNGENSLTF